MDLTHEQTLEYLHLQMSEKRAKDLRNKTIQAQLLIDEVLLKILINKGDTAKIDHIRSTFIELNAMCDFYKNKYEEIFEKSCILEKRVLDLNNKL